MYLGLKIDFYINPLYTSQQEPIDHQKIEKREAMLNLLSQLLRGNKKGNISGKSMPVSEEIKAPSWQEDVWYENAAKFLEAHKGSLFDGEKLAEGIKAKTGEEDRFYRNFSLASGSEGKGIRI